VGSIAPGPGSSPISSFGNDAREPFATEFVRSYLGASGAPATQWITDTKVEDSMRSTITRRRVIGGVGLTLLALAASALPVGAQGPATLKALGGYRLTMPTIRKVVAAGNAIERGPDADAVGRATSDPAMSIDQLVAVFGRYPSAKQAVAASGLSPREFATATLSLYWATRFLAEQEMYKSLGRPQTGPPAHVPPENVELVRANQAEIERLSRN
jgi:hypothetical protein